MTTPHRANASLDTLNSEQRSDTPRLAQSLRLFSSEPPPYIKSLLFIDPTFPLCVSFSVLSARAKKN